MNLFVNRRVNEGFTIVELLIVIVVIGVLAAISLVSYTGINKKAVIASLQSDLTNASSQLKMFQVDKGYYPTGIDCSSNPATDTICLKSSSGNSFGSYDPSVAQTFYLKLENTNGECWFITENAGPTICSPPITPVTLSYTGAYQTYTVPAGVTKLTMETWGAQGGGATGGLGGYAKGIITVTSGETLRIYVGGQGGTGTCAGNACMPGGFNGGGNGGGSDITSTGYGGGGATDIRRSPYNLADRLIVAGGGGAKGGLSSPSSGAGGAGGQVGGNGIFCPGPDCGYDIYPGGPGLGATQSAAGAGGAAGYYSYTTYPGGGGASGVLGQGGDGCMCWNAGSGGGGGGYYGGGGGGCPGQHGGGGGSSWITPSATNTLYTTGSRSGNGQAILSAG